MNIKTKMLLVSTLFAILLSECKKHDINILTNEKNSNNEIRFFRINANANSKILQINKSLQEQNQKNPFISNFIKLAGYPKWDKGFFLPKRGSNQRIVQSNIQSATTSSDSNYIIPVVSESDRVVTGAIIVKIGDTTSYNLVLLKDYESYNTNKATFVKAMMILDAKVYGYNRFKIEDTSVIHTKVLFFKNDITSRQTNRESVLNYDDPCDIIEIWKDPDGDADLCDCSGNEYYTGDWYYADEDNCFSTTPQPVLSYLIGGIGNGLPEGYYILPGLSGGGTTGGSSTPPYTPIPKTEQQKTDYLIDKLNLGQTQQFYLVNTSEAINTLFSYIYGNNTTEAESIAIWAIDYFSQHQDVNMQIFANQFLGKSEGYEGEYDNYWDAPPPFQQQNLPSWSDFNTAFPKVSDPLYDTPEKMYNSIGGAVATFYSGPKTNTCAIRLSKALNYSGVVIPNISGQTHKGADNKYYFIAAYQLNIWMRKTFGTNPATSTSPLNTNHFFYNQTDAGVNGVNLPTLLAGKKGIYSIYSSDFNWASGHADLLNDNGTCGNNCHFADAPILRLDIWTLN